ncbi:DMT family transporter [Phormidium sp. LEGE 05292]|uniref:DMT family transporter n=1 Tax=[Phormidium] sp. LEGE 05292 TaxID=767427 RepID=UPI001881D5AF|nr:DMT family transporter [Phormidium sp. LEGE 05292]MBE9225320.1 DMT family transporter [Phormidium sp. LEGE 05292]
MNSISLSRIQAIVFRCQIWLYLLLALLSGAVLPIQTSLNAQLARGLNSVPLAANISYFVGALVLVMLLLTGQFGELEWSALIKAPRWSLVGGLLGAWYIASSAYFASILGTTLTIGFVIGGQAIAGIIIDHFGWLGMPQYRLTRHRRFAIGLLIVALFFLVQPR